MYDSFYNEIEIGDTLAYAVRWSSQLHMKKGVVTAIESDRITIKVINNDPRPWRRIQKRFVYLTRPTCAIIKKGNKE